MTDAKLIILFIGFTFNLKFVTLRGEKGLIKTTINTANHNNDDDE